MDWFEQAKIDRENGMSINEIAEKYNKPYKTVESRFYWDKKRNGTAHVNHNSVNQNLQESILKDIQKECKIPDLCRQYKVSERVLKAAIEDIKDSGYDVQIYGDTVQLNKVTQEENKVHSINLTDGWHKMGVVTDTHLNSKFQQLTHLKRTYEIFDEEGCECVLHAGDISAGQGMYKGQEYEIFNMGADAQSEYIIANYPKLRNGGKTKLVAGNHDLSFYTRMGVDICKKIAGQREDIDYLGQLGAYIEIAPNVTIYILHPDAGVSYAVSYKPQKIASGFMGGNKPNIMILGHWHQAEYLFERNIHIVQAGCFEAQTSLLKRKGIMPKIGGWIIEFKIEDNSVTRFKQQWITFFNEIKNDY